MKKLFFLLLVLPFLGFGQTCTIPGNNTVYGDNAWIGYVYSGTSFNTYKGYINQDQNFDNDMGSNGIVDAVPTVCGAYATQFSIRYRMKMTGGAGQYNITVGGDDGYRLSVDGGANWVINNWNEHSYGTTSIQLSLTTSTNLVLEYYQANGTSHVSFTTTKVEGDPNVFGSNVWNVYTYNGNTITPVATSYLGYYVQSTLGVNTQDTANNGWGTTLSPSSSAGWHGAPVAIDNFLMVHKRQGFPCGNYKIKMEDWDDGMEVYLDGTLITSNTGYSGGAGGGYVIKVGATTTERIFSLNSNSKMEVRLREAGGNAGINMTMTKVVTTNNGSGWVGSTDGADIKIDGNVTLTSDLAVCSCTVSAGAKLTIAAGKSLTVKEFVKVIPTGDLVVENNANLVQIDEVAANSGSITVKRNSTNVTQYDFTYWSSPVSNALVSVLSGTFDLGPTYVFDQTINNWSAVASGSTVMQVGKGYISRAPNNMDFSTTPKPVVSVVFKGPSNSGVVNAAVNRVGTTSSNLIGNPYPSAIDANKFLDANAANIYGTLYFWTHKTAISNMIPGNEAYNYTANDYAVYNRSGGVGTSSTGYATPGNPAVTSAVPNGYIASGQGFFVKKKVAGTGTVVFNNSMRATGATNSQFFKPAYEEYSTQEMEGRVWLNFTNTQGAFSQTLVAYKDGATNEFDSLFDGQVMNGGNFVSLYSLTGTTKLTIQGKATPFNTADVVAMGYKTTIAGTFTIAIDQVDGFFNSQNVYLLDKVLNTVTDLKEGAYTFATEIGTFDTRFELKYTNQVLGIDVPTVDKNAIGIIRNGNQVLVNAKSETIASVEIYDITGKLVYQKNGINNNEFASNELNVHNQVVVVKVKTDTNVEIVKKVIMN